MRMYISLLILFSPVFSSAQTTDEYPAKQIPFLMQEYAGEIPSTENLGGSYSEFVSSFEFTGPKIDASWEFLGPSVQPIEKPAKNALPNYSLGRGNGTGRINYLLLDPYVPHRVFACSPSGGLFVSKDDGLNWEVAGTDALPISGVASIAVDKKDPDRWWICTGDGDDNFMFSDGVWRTENAGKSWENLNGVTDSTSIPVSVLNWEYTRSCEIVSHPKRRKKLFYSSNKGLYACKNGTRSPEYIQWQKQLDGFIYDFEFLPWKKKHMIASGDHIYFSKNYGKKWKMLPDPELQNKDHKFIRISPEFSPVDKQHIYAVVTSRKEWGTREIGAATLQKFNLKTEKWTVIRNLKLRMNNVVPSRARAFAISPIDSTLILCANVQPVYRSTDGGLNFEGIDSKQMHDDVHHLVFDDNGKTVWASHDGGVSISFDAGLTWEDRSNGIGAANVFGVDVAQTEKLQLLYGGYDTGGNLLLDEKWYHVCFGDGFQNLIHDENPDWMISTRQNGGLVKAVSDGVFENRISTSESKTAWHTWYKSDPFNPNTVFLAGTKLMRSTDFGDSWESILDASQFENMYWTYTLTPSEFHEDVLYSYLLPESGMGHRIARTFNANAGVDDVKWELVQEFPIDQWVTGIQPHPTDPKQFYLAFGIFNKKDKLWHFDGENYKDITYNLGYAIPDAMITDQETGALYLGTTHGVFILDKESKAWIQLDGLPGTFIRSLVINYATGKLVAGSYGRGIWQADLIRP